MKTEQNVLKNIFKKLVALCALLYLTGCKPYSYGILEIHNGTDTDIIIQHNLNSEEYVVIPINSDECARVSETEKYESINPSISIAQFVSNPDATVQVYIETKDKILLIKEWKYLEREEQGKQFFNDLCLSHRAYGGPDGGQYYFYTFTIVQDDIL